MAGSCAAGFPGVVSPAGEVVGSGRTGASGCAATVGAVDDAGTCGAVDDAGPVGTGWPAAGRAAAPPASGLTGIGGQVGG
jgi:hypothetical protein